MASILDKWADERERVVRIEFNGEPIYVRARAATAGELMGEGAGGLMVPQGKGRAPVRMAPEQQQRQALAVQEALLHYCVLGIGDSETTIEPVTIRRNEQERARPGTRSHNISSLPLGVVSALAEVVITLTHGEGWREKLATFPDVGVGDDRRPGGEVQPTANGPA